MLLPSANKPCRDRPSFDTAPDRISWRPPALIFAAIVRRWRQDRPTRSQPITAMAKLSSKNLSYAYNSPSQLASAEFAEAIGPNTTAPGTKLWRRRSTRILYARLRTSITELYAPSPHFQSNTARMSCSVIISSFSPFTSTSMPRIGGKQHPIPFAHLALMPLAVFQLAGHRRSKAPAPAAAFPAPFPAAQFPPLVFSPPPSASPQYGPQSARLSYKPFSQGFQIAPTSAKLQIYARTVVP